MKTFQSKSKDIKRQWHLIDASQEVLGRTATKVTSLLIGKHKTTYTPHLDMGDFVVVINAGKIKVSGNKAKQKTYYKHSGYPGGFKEISFKKLFDTNPEKIMQLAVKNMLPKNRLQKQRLTRLRIVKSDKHKYEDKFN